MAAKKMPKETIGKEKTKSGKTVELSEHRAMIYLPEDACEITIDARVFHEGELIHVSKVMNMQEIREAYRKADDGYIDDDDQFVITEKGLAELEEARRLGVTGSDLP